MRKKDILVEGPPTPPRHPDRLRRRDPFFILFGKEAGTYSLRGLALLFGVFFGALLFAGLFAPFVFIIFQWLAGLEVGFAEYVVDKGFLKTFDRIRWIPVVLALPFLLSACRLWSLRKLGFRNPADGIRSVAGWWLVGMASLAFVALMHVHFLDVLGLPFYKETKPFLAVALSAALTAFAIAFLEELILRGMVFRMFYTAMPPIAAIIGSSLFFAAVHLKDIPSDIWAASDSPGIGEGLLAAFWTVANLPFTFEALAFLNLTLVGICLAALFLKTRSLWPCVGLHAGWVWTLIVYKEYMKVPGSETTFMLGSHRLTDGLVTACVLGIIACIMLRANLRSMRHRHLRSEAA